MAISLDRSYDVKVTCRGGLGAAFGRGCLIGNIMTGWVPMCVGIFMFRIAFVLGKQAAAHFYLTGEEVSDYMFLRWR